MKTYNHLLGVAATLVAALGTVSATPAGAMGRSGAPTRTEASQASVEARLARIESDQCGTQDALMEELQKLRKEVNELKALQAMHALDGGFAAAE